jgi:hypothetical protein
MKIEELKDEILRLKRQRYWSAGAKEAAENNESYEDCLEERDFRDQIVKFGSSNE